MEGFELEVVAAVFGGVLVERGLLFGSSEVGTEVG